MYVDSDADHGEAQALLIGRDFGQDSAHFSLPEKQIIGPAQIAGDVAHA